MIRLRHLYIAKGHSFFGRWGKGAADFPIAEVPRLHCVAGRGIEGDRFFDYKPDYKGQITLFAWEEYERLRDRFAVQDKDPGAFRRNVITQGIDLNSLIGQEFALQGVKFLGSSECTPCEWMDEAFHPGTYEALHGVGGLRARILTDGWLEAEAAAIPAPTLR
jgi:MOSC domain-containing protein YiiM